MPSPLVPVTYVSAHSTSYQTAVVQFLAPCVCGRDVLWTATASGAAPTCDCGEEAA